MVYRVLAIIDSQKEALVAGFVQLEVSGRNWGYELKSTARFEYTDALKAQISKGNGLSAVEYLQLHEDYGTWIAHCVNKFIEEQQLQFQVQLIASPGLQLISPGSYTVGDGAAIAAITGINTVCDFKAMDAALGGSNQQLAYQSLLPVTDVDQIEIVHTALFAVLRWREENNMMAGQTAASRDSIGGAVWIGQEW